MRFPYLGLNNHRPDTEYITNESLELTLGENSTWGQRLTAAFPAFQSQNYQLYFYGQLVSLVGTWLQMVAESWLVLQLSNNSAFLIGIVAAAASVPTLLLSLVGGVIVDRFPKKKILLLTQTAAMFLAFTLGILTITHIITIYQEIVLAFLLGIVNAIDSPARQSFVVKLIDRSSLASAIALNSGTFNAARVIGPSIAGLLIGFVGTGGAFILNGVSYIAVIIALLKIKTSEHPHPHQLNPLAAIKEGLSYSYRHLQIRIILIYMSILSIFGWSYSTLMPLIAKTDFHLSATGLGYLFAVTGLGALTATFAVSAFSKKIKRSVFILGGNYLFSLSLLAFTFTSQVGIAMIWLFIVGLGLLSMSATMATMIQSAVDDRFRGRVMSLYTLVFLGLMPVGNLEVGYLSEHFGSRIAIRIGAIIILLCGVIIHLNREKISNLSK